MKLLYSYHDSLGTVGRGITADEAYGLARPEPNDPRGERPWIAMCMVSGIDGSTVVNGSSQALSGPADREVLLALRQAADTVLVGAGTVRDEGYGPPLKAGQRIAVASRSGGLDLSLPLFTSGAGFVVSPQDGGMFAMAHSLPGRFVQLEGGAKLNASMIDADLVDEINLTISPNVTGGAGPRLTDGAADALMRFDVHHILEDDGFVFLRYVRRR